MNGSLMSRDNCDMAKYDCSHPNLIRIARGFRVVSMDEMTLIMCLTICCSRIYPQALFSAENARISSAPGLPLVDGPAA